MSNKCTSWCISVVPSTPDVSIQIILMSSNPFVQLNSSALNPSKFTWLHPNHQSPSNYVQIYPSSFNYTQVHPMDVCSTYKNIQQLWSVDTCAHKHFFIYPNPQMWVTQLYWSTYSPSTQANQVFYVNLVHHAKCMFGGKVAQQSYLSFLTKFSWCI